MSAFRPGPGMPEAGPDEAPVTFLRHSMPEVVERMVHILEHGDLLVCGATWRDVVAVVEYGEVELETPHGGRLRLVQGDVVSFALTGPVTVHASDGGLSVLATVRHCTDHPQAPAPQSGSTT